MNWALTIAGAAAASVAGSVFSTPLSAFSGSDGGYGVIIAQLICLSLGGAFGGFFVSAVNPRDRLWPAAYAGVAAALLVSLLVTLQTLKGVGDSVPAGAWPRILWWTAAWVSLPILVALPVATMAGAWLERTLAAAALWLSPPVRWEYVTRGGRRIPATDPPRYPFQATFWWACRLGFFVGAVMLPLLLGWNWKDFFALLILGGVCGVIARKRNPRSAREALARDPRPPIIYLRSFRDDGRSTGESGWSRFAVAIGSLLSPPFEEVLGRTFSRHGPFVAIGRPGEEVADLGAARMYVSDDDWQVVVGDLLTRPGAVAVLQAGATAGLRWELTIAGRVLRPEQLLVFMPFALEPSDRARQEQYAAFRAWASECLPGLRLPAQFPLLTRYLYFGADPAWEVFTLKLKSPVPPDHPLAPVLTDLQTRWRTISRPRTLGDRVRFVVFLVLGLLLLLFLACGGMVLSGWRPPPSRPPAPVNPTPILPQPVEYLGRALPYRIRLAPEWREKPEAKGVDRHFNIPSGPDLRVLVLDHLLGLDDYVAALSKNLAQGGAPVEPLEKTTIQGVGGRPPWEQQRLRFRVKDAPGLIAVRALCRAGKTILLVTIMDESDGNWEKGLAGLNGFELPPDPPAD